MWLQSLFRLQSELRSELFIANWLHTKFRIPITVVIAIRIQNRLHSEFCNPMTIWILYAIWILIAIRSLKSDCNINCDGNLNSGCNEGCKKNWDLTLFSCNSESNLNSEFWSQLRLQYDLWLQCVHFLFWLFPFQSEYEWDCNQNSELWMQSELKKLTLVVVRHNMKRQGKVFGQVDTARRSGGCLH